MTTKKGADIILMLGESGSGKSTSLRELDPKETVLIKPNPNSLPFPGYEKNYVQGENLFITNDIKQVRGLLVNDNLKKFKYVVVEDLNLFFNERTTSPGFIAQNSGNAAFAKWNQFAADVIQAFVAPAQSMAAGSYLIILAHTDVKDDGKIGLKTSGKLLDNNLYIPAYATYVFHTLITGDDKSLSYKFLTNSDGRHLAKSPAGAFDLYIPNNLKPAIDRIEAYKAGDIKNIVWK